jgi:hypothetical protein
MKSTSGKSAPRSPPYYRGAEIPLPVIREFASAVAERFRPDKIVLFGS